MQFVNAAHQRQIDIRDGTGQVIHRAPADAEQRGLTRDGEIVVTVDHDFALSNPALVSARSKKSFSSASWPIFACSGARSTGWAVSELAPKTSAARSSNCFFQSAIWFGCIRQACADFTISQTGYRYTPTLSDENVRIADWLVRLTHTQRNWGFGLCFLYLRNVKRFGWNHKRVYRIYRSWN